jgi:hypothetical protein
MGDELEKMEKAAGEGRNFERPPLHLWHPPLTGDIDIRIAADGIWYHEGAPIRRASLVALFASILRREEDGEYYLVTPAEKWRIAVEVHPLVVTDVEAVEEEGARVLRATINTGKTVVIGDTHPLFLEPAVGNIAAVRLWHGLAALFGRAAWYRLVEMAEEHEGVVTVFSGENAFPLQG